MDLPRWLTPDEVVLHPYTGAGVRGPVYGAPVASRARYEPGEHYVRDRTGARVLCVGRLWLPLDVDEVPAESLVTLPGGREATVARVKRHDYGPSTPNHWEVSVR